MQVPNFDCEIISGDHVATGVGKFDVGYRGNDFGEETAIRRILGFLEH